MKLVPINVKNREELAKLYKQVYAGHPWHEDLICANARRTDGTACTAQFTKENCNRFDKPAKGEIDNDCRGSYSKRRNIFLLNDAPLENCPVCNDALKLIEYYPEFLNHTALINEAIGLPGFIGYVMESEEGIIAFSWGFRFPEARTKTVDFPKAERMLRERGIDSTRLFYGAETGVRGDFQRRGIGSYLIAEMLGLALKQDYCGFVIRTINPYMHSIINRSFSGRAAEELFKDPVRTSRWYMWNFSNFDPSIVEKSLGG